MNGRILAEAAEPRARAWPHGAVSCNDSSRAVRIAFHKSSDDRHVLSLVHDDGREESVDCETRSYLVHDLLHYAVESELGTEHGVWGLLAKGITLECLNDRSRPLNASSELGQIETIVGLVSGVVKGRTPSDLVEGLRANADALSWPVPEWFHERFVANVNERMRHLLGRWRATAYGGSMELRWPEP